MSELEHRLLDDIRKRIIEGFLDIVILQELDKRPLGCYDIISSIHNKHDVQLSSGRTYSRLYALERDGLLRSKLNSNKRVFMLTENGKKTVKELREDKRRIFGLFLTLFESE